jgi:hypothetical protein
MPIAPLEKFGLGGLITDLPREALSTTYFDQGLDMRPFDEALRGVFDWDTADTRTRLFQLSTDGAAYASTIASTKPLTIAQWTKSGTDFLDILTVGVSTGDAGQIYVTGGDADPAIITESSFPNAFTYDPATGFNAFIFNELAIVNPTTAGPMYSFDRGVNFYDLPNWFGEPTGSAITATSLYSVYYIESIVLNDWSTVGGPLNAAVGNIYTAIGNDDVSTLGTVRLLHPYNAARMTVYNGRLVAVNLFNDLNDGDPLNDITSPIEMAYSSSISSIGSILDLEWYASANNTAGNTFLTQTPGKVIDAKQLGEFLMVYKTDAVLRMQDTGEPLFVTGETAFLDDGVLSYDCVADIGGNRHFVVGNYGIYIHTGGPEKDIVSSDKTSIDFYNDLPVALDDRSLTFVFHDSIQKEVWTCYRHRAAATGDAYKGCTRALVFSYDKGTFYTRSLPNVTKIIETEVNGIVEIIASSIDEAAGSTVTGYLYPLSKTDYVPDGWVQFTTRELGMVELVKAFNGFYPTSRGAFDMKVAPTPTPSEPNMNLVTAYTFDPTNDYKLDFRELGRYYTIRIQMDNAINPILSMAKVDMVAEGER